MIVVHGVQRIPVIRTMVTYGRGTDKDPARVVTEYWDDDGKLLWRDDPLAERFEKKPTLTE